MASFGWALDSLQLGNKVARKGWNGKGMWLTYVLDWTATFNVNLLQALEDWETLPFIAMKTVDNKMVPWLASQTDVLANDWELIV